MRAPSGSDSAVAEALLSVENVSLSFGGVRALTDVSFDVRTVPVPAMEKAA